MAVITTKNIKAKKEPLSYDDVPEPGTPKQEGELNLIIRKIIRNCGPTSEINRLANRALELIK